MILNSILKKLQNWSIKQSLDHSKRTVVISFLLTIIFSYGLRFIIIDDDMMKMLPKNLESRILWDSIQKEFGSTESIFIAFGNKNQNILNQEALETSWKLAKELKKLKSVQNVISISTKTRVDNIDDFLEINQLQESETLNENQILAIKSYLNVNKKLKKQLISKNESYFLTIVHPDTIIGLDRFRDGVVGVCSNILEKYEVHYSGTAYITGSIPQLIRKDIRGLILIGTAIMIFVLMINLRNIIAVFMVLMVIILSLISMLGAMGWLFKLTNSDKFLFALLNTSMPIILLTIANSDGVHVITKFFKELRKTKNTKKSLHTTLLSLQLPIFLTSITTIGAFLTMVFSPLEPLIGYGICISIGIACAWLFSSITLPALMIMYNWNTKSRVLNEKGPFEIFINFLSRIVLRRPKLLFTLGVLIISVSSFGILSLNVDVNLSSFFKPETEIRDSMDFMDEEMAGTMDLRIRIEGDMRDPQLLKKIDSLQTFIEKNETISLTNSISDVVKEMHCTFMNDSIKYKTIPNTKSKINNLFTMYDLSGNAEDLSFLVNQNNSAGLVSSLSSTMSTDQVFSFIENISQYISLKFSKFHTMNVTGIIVVIRDLVILIIQSSFISIALSLIFVIVISSIFFNGILWGILASIPLTGSIILNFGLMGYLNIPLNHITAILSSIIIGVGIDFAIHFIAKYRNLQKENIKDNLTQETFKEAGYPILLDAVSNMGFGALLFSSFLPVQFIGGLMIIAMFSTSFGTLIILTTLVQLFQNNIKNNR